MQQLHVLQHYRAKQRQYMHWRTEQEDKRVEPCFFPPRSRQLRSEWFAKRFEKYGRQASLAEPESRSNDQNVEIVSPAVDEVEEIAKRIWKWLNCSEVSEEQEKLLLGEGK